MLDETEFLSPYGIRSLSLVHRDNPYVFDFGGQRHEVRYVPGESDSAMFGGNSNWRGPIWFPTTFLLIQSLKRYHVFYGDEFRVEYPTGSGNSATLLDVARDLECRMISLFEKDATGRRPSHGDDARYAEDPDLERLDFVLRVFSRGQRQGDWRKPSNRMDGTGRIDAAQPSKHAEVQVLASEPQVAGLHQSSDNHNACTTHPSTHAPHPPSFPRSAWERTPRPLRGQKEPA